LACPLQARDRAPAWGMHCPSDSLSPTSCLVLRLLAEELYNDGPEEVMQYNVAELLKGPVGVTRQYEIGEVPEFAVGGAQLIGAVSGSVKLMRTQEGILAETELKATIASQCARCLKPVQTVIATEFVDEYRPTVDIRTGFRIQPLPEETVDAELMIGADHVLRLDEAARQELEAAIPMQILCAPDCAGLCQHCGHDLNEGPCDCEPETDARWEPLRQVLAQAATD